MSNPGHEFVLAEAKVAAHSLGVRLQALEARGPDNFASAFAAMTRERASALSHLPAIYGLSEHVEAGGLVVYGASLRENSRRAATYVDKIFKGAKPADLPVEQPTKFELVINLKTAKALRLTIPSSVLLRADEVIR